MGPSGDGNPDWVGKTSSTLPGGGVPVESVRTVPHRTVSYCLTAYDPHSSRPHFFKSGHTAWHGTKESTWYLARNYHEPSTVPARKRATGPSQPEPGIAPYYYVQHTPVSVLYPALALARACGEKVASLRVPLYGTAGWLAAGPLLLNPPLLSRLPTGPAS